MYEVTFDRNFFNSFELLFQAIVRKTLTYKKIPHQNPLQFLPPILIKTR